MLTDESPRAPPCQTSLDPCVINQCPHDSPGGGAAPPMPQTPHPNRPCLLESLHHHLSTNNLADALDSLPLLARRGLRPSLSTLAILLRRCLLAGALTFAARLHLYLHLTGLKHSFPSHTLLSNHLLSFHFLRGRPADAARLFAKMPAPNLFSSNAMLAGYARLGQLTPARLLFAQMPERDTVSWNTMIIALARGGAPREAIQFYSQLCSSTRLTLNAHTFSGLLTACVRLTDPRLIVQAHAQVHRSGFTSNIIICSSLLDAYAKCGFIDCAHRLFDEMPVRDVMVWTTIVHGYAKSGDLVTARRLFDAMPERNPVTWTALIGGYAHGGLSLEALDLFRHMTSQGVPPDHFTFSSSLCACAAIASLKHGKQIHARMFRMCFSPNVIVLSSLVDMYSKCGDLAGGRRVFDYSDLSKRDVVMWNTMISAFGQHGCGRVAIQLFEEMVGAGVRPDGNTFVVVLTACNHSGFVSEGVQFFEAMTESYDIVPREEHYMCLMDLLGRAGQFEEAMRWLRKMPFQSSTAVWKVMLGACRIHKNLQLGIEAAERLIELESESSATYVLLSNIYAELGRWDSAERVRQLMEERKVRKERATSWISVDDTVHSFEVSDKLHPLMEEIYAALEQLVSQMDDNSSVT